MTDFRQTSAFGSYLACAGWKKAQIDSENFAYYKKFPILGIVIRIPRSSPNLDLDKVNTLIFKLRPAFTKIEPNALLTNTHLRSRLESHGFTLDTWSIEPTQTLTIDLTQPENLLFKNLGHGWKRDIKIAQKHGITITTSTNINTFYTLWQLNSKNKGFHIETRHQCLTLWNNLYHTEQGILLFALVGNRPVAAAFLIFDSNTVHLWHLASNSIFANKKPLYLLIWESILLGKKRGLKFFDFEGIPDARLPQTNSLYPRIFKKGFGGQEKILIGSFTKYSNPAVRLLFQSITRFSPKFIYTTYRKISYNDR